MFHGLAGVILDGWWCLLVAGVILDGWWCASLVAGVILDGWWCLLASSAAYCSRAPRQGHAPRPSVRWDSRIKKSSVDGMFLRCYCSICQLFKFSNRMLNAKVFMGENFIKTLFLINYRGYLIIQSIHFTINYSYFLHKTDRKHVENQ